MIDPRPFQAALDQASAKKAQDVAQSNNAKITFQRNADLLQKKVLDQQTFDTSRFLVDQLEGTVRRTTPRSRALRSSSTIRPSPRRSTGESAFAMSTLVLCPSFQHHGIGLDYSVKTDLCPFYLPQQQLNQVNEEAAKGTLKVLAVDRDNIKTLAEGTLAVVDNQIDTTTGTVN